MRDLMPYSTVMIKLRLRVRISHFQLLTFQNGLWVVHLLPGHGAMTE